MRGGVWSTVVWGGPTEPPATSTAQPGLAHRELQRAHGDPQCGAEEGRGQQHVTQKRNGGATPTMLAWHTKQARGHTRQT